MLIRIVSWFLLGWLTILRVTCRYTYHNDPRDQLHADGRGYVFGFLHAHQLSIMLRAQTGTAAMVSQSRDGQLIVPILRSCGCVVIRGSKRSHGKARGGREAIDAIVQHTAGGRPAAIAVDGPRGPRGKVHKGAAFVAQQADVPVLVLVTRPHRRIIVGRAWDRMQIPWPFSRVDGYFSEPMYCQPGERLESFRRRLQEKLAEMEASIDPDEFRYSLPANCTNNQDDGQLHEDSACQSAA